MDSMGTFIKALLLGLILIGSTLWGVLAVYFGDSHTGIVQTGVSVIFGFCGLASLISLGFPHWRKRLLLGYSILFAAILTWWFLISPSNERQWQPDVAKLAYATFDGDLVTVHNIRNFDYRSEFDYQPAYYTNAFDLNKLVGVQTSRIRFSVLILAAMIIWLSRSKRVRSRVRAIRRSKAFSGSMS